MANAVPSGVRFTASGDELNLTAAAASDGLKRFTINAYNGGKLSLGGWSLPVVVDLAGLKVTAKPRPILRDHDPAKIVGHTESVDIQPKRLVVNGVLSAGNGYAKDIEVSAGNGFPWQASIGATADTVIYVDEGESVEVNGRKFIGPLYVSRQTTLGEISFVALGADDSTSAKFAASTAPNNSSVKVIAMTLEKWIEAKGFKVADLDDVQKASLQAMFDAESKVHQPAPVAAAAPVQAAAPKQPESVPSLDQIFAERRKEDERIAEITRITAEAVNDRPMLVDEFEKMSRSAIEAKTQPQEYELAILRASRARVSPSNGFGRVGDRKASSRVLEAALCISGGMQDAEKMFDDQTLQAAHDRFQHGIGLRDVLLIAARENGYTGDHSGRDVRGLLSAAFPQNGQMQAHTGFSTFSLSGILANTANKFLNMGFNSVESSWREISAIRSVRDFKQITSYSLTGGFEYEKVGPGGELKHATVGELSYTNKAETYGKMFAITRQDIINDDLGALTDIPRKLGRGAALKLNSVFWTAFMDNASFFSSGNKNYTSGAGTVLGVDSLTTGETLFLNQTDPDGNPLAVNPTILLVPNALYVLANQIMNATNITVEGSTATTKTPSNNPHAGKFKVVRSSYLSNTNITGNSTTAWYLLADPNDMPVIEVAFLNGREQPVVESADADFNTLGVQMRGYHDFGVSKQEYRGGVKVKGAA